MDYVVVVRSGHSCYLVFHLSHDDLDNRGSHIVERHAAGNSAAQESSCQVDEEKVLNHRLCCLENMSCLHAFVSQRHLEPYGYQPSGYFKVQLLPLVVYAYAFISEVFVRVKRRRASVKFEG